MALIALAVKLDGSPVVLGRSWRIGTALRNRGSVERLKLSVRCGCRQKAFQMRWMVEGAWPTAAAIERNDQWVASGGIVSSVRRIVSAISSMPRPCGGFWRCWAGDLALGAGDAGMVGRGPFGYA